MTARWPDLSDEERTYLLMLILSKFEYAGWKWDNTVGGLEEYFTVPWLGPAGYVPKRLDHLGTFEFLGLDKAAYEHLKFTLKRQHRFAEDTRDVDTAFPKPNSDDYKADLDAVNLAGAARRGSSFTDGAARYYEDLNAGRSTRADQFLEQYPLGHIRERVGVDPEKLPGQPYPVGLHPVTRRFLESLEAGANDLLD
jgi:hypothetical protein